MSSGKDRPLLRLRGTGSRSPEGRPPREHKRPILDRLRLARKGLASGLRRPPVSIQLWLTALFAAVTFIAGLTAYSIVYPILRSTLELQARAAFNQIGNDFENQLERNPRITEARIAAYATGRNAEWGIVSPNGGEVLKGNPGDFDPEVVELALRENATVSSLEPVASGERKGQTLGTYAAPFDAERLLGERETAIVFTHYYTRNDVRNVEAALLNIQRLALLAFGLALLIAGFTGYVVANLIARRLSGLDIAARHLAAGNFDERIETRVRDEVGSLGETFNAMAYSLKGAFRQLEQEKVRSGAILDGMTDAVVGVDADLNPTFLNPEARELLETSGPEFRERLQRALAKSRFSGPITESEAEAAGDRIVEIRAAPLEDGALAIMRDVTEERRLERTKSEFIANASHELKTPLFALSGNLDLLEDEEDEGMRREFLGQMRAATTRLEELAKTLLELSRIDANAVTFRLEEVDLEDELHALKREFASRGREIRIRAQSDLPPVRTDPTQLYRVLAILLDNAIKYSGGPNGDTPVDLELYRSPQDKGRVLVGVADRGCGIPEAELPHVFERFYRAQGSSRADGTGLGLALAWEIAQHLGGDILMQSVPDKGSTFYVELPLEDDPTAGDHPAGNEQNLAFS